MRDTPTLLTVRSALILGISGVIGAFTAALMLHGSENLATSVIAAGAATAGAVGLLDQIIGSGEGE